MKKQKNVWKIASIVMVIFCLLMISWNFYSNRQTEEQQVQEAMKFLEFAKENQLEEICDIDEGICCNTRTGKCFKVIEDGK